MVYMKNDKTKKWALPCGVYCVEERTKSMSDTFEAEIGSLSFSLTHTLLSLESVVCCFGPALNEGCGIYAFVIRLERDREVYGGFHSSLPFILSWGV